MTTEELTRYASLATPGTLPASWTAELVRRADEKTDALKEAHKQIEKLEDELSDLD